MSDRAVLFVDGNNWFHALAGISVGDRMHLDYSKISQKLLGPRAWIETRYYIGRVTHNATFMANQKQFVTQFTGTDRRLTVHFGRIEKRPASNALADDLLHYLAGLKAPIDKTVYHELVALARAHKTTPVFVEKAVDVMLAVDMVTMAADDHYDAAYLLSADGDFTPAVRFARARGKKVYVASPCPGAQLAAVANSFLPLEKPWFVDCYR